MDQVNKLIENENYQEALKILLQFEGHYIEKVQCLFELKKYDELISFYNSIKNSLEKDYYEVLGYVINTLIIKEDFDTALDLLNEELSMPYIPQNYEEIINNLYDDVISLKQLYLNENNHYLIYSEDNVKEILESDNNYHNLSDIVVNLDKYNLRNLVKSIELFLKRDVSNVLKSIVLEEFLKQEITQSVIVIKDSLEFEYLPASNTYVEDNENYQKLIDLLIKHLDKTPSFLEMALAIVNKYVYIIYPLTIDDDEVYLLSYVIEYYVLTLNMEDFGADYENYDLNIEMIENGYESLQNILRIESEYENV